METADIIIPPGNTAQRHIQASAYLSLECLKGAADIAGPDRGTIALAASPLWYCELCSSQYHKDEKK